MTLFSFRPSIDISKFRHLKIFIEIRFIDYVIYHLLGKKMFLYELYNCCAKFSLVKFARIENYEYNAQKSYNLRDTVILKG